ncbi:MAG: hypothetical protein OHK0015_17560 [Chloroflexi bacterium OHK40]|jgi:hypothetical protein
MELLPDEPARFERIAGRAWAAVGQLGPPLRAQATERLGRLITGAFSRIVALLPAWLTDLAPLDDGRCDLLGSASLYLWWHGQLIDDLIDGAEGLDALPVAQFALTRALDGYQQAGLLASADAWGELLALSEASAHAYARELATRPLDVATVSDELLAAWTPELAMDRAGPACFVVTAQLALAAQPQATLRADIASALRQLLGARQLADDASDWLADLKAGHLNVVAAGLIRSLRARTAPENWGSLSLERLAGFELRAEPFWAQVEQTHAGLCSRALARLAPYGPCRLQQLVERQRAHDEAVFARMRQRRATLRSVFGAQALGSAPPDG